MDQPDKELLERILKGDHSSESFLVGKYNGALGKILALKYNINQEDLDDILNETWLRVIKAARAGKIRKPDSLRAYIVKIARNVSSELIRKKGIPEGKSETVEELFNGGVQGDPLKTLTDAEIRLAVKETLPQLNRDYVRVLQFIMDGEKTEEAITQLNISPGNYRARKHRAIAAFKKAFTRHLKKKGITYP